MGIILTILTGVYRALSFSRYTPKHVCALWDNFQCFPMQQSEVARNGLQMLLSELSTRGYFKEGMNILGPSRRQIQGEAFEGGALYGLGLINAGWGIGFLVGGYLHETLKAAQGMVVWHGVALGLSIAGMGKKNTEPYIAYSNNSCIPLFHCDSLLHLLWIISNLFLTYNLILSSAIQMLIAFHTNQPHIQFWK